jgi:hypothetical protein
VASDGPWPGLAARSAVRSPSGTTVPFAGSITVRSGPPDAALWHPAAAAERDASWPAGEKVTMLHAVQKLQAAGPRLGHPRSSAVRGEMEGLPRATAAGRSQPMAPDLPPVNPSTFVIFAVAPEAEIDSRGYDAAVARAVERFGQLEVDSGLAWNRR